MLRTLLPLSVLTLALAAHAEPEGDHVRVELTGPSTPYARVVYQVGYRRGTVIAEVDKVFAGGFGRRGEVGLLSLGDLGALLDELEALGIASLPDRRAERPGTIWTVSTLRSGRRHRFEVHDPELRADPRYRAVIDRVRDLVDATVGPVPFRDRMLLPAESGRLRIKSTPKGWVWIDGVRIEGTTPMVDLRLTPGAHTVKMTPVGSDEAYTYEVKIDIGRTTSLVVELR